MYDAGCWDTWDADVAAVVVAATEGACAVGRLRATCAVVRRATDALSAAWVIPTPEGLPRIVAHEGAPPTAGLAWDTVSQAQASADGRWCRVPVRDAGPLPALLLVEWHARRGAGGAPDWTAHPVIRVAAGAAAPLLRDLTERDGIVSGTGDATGIIGDSPEVRAVREAVRRFGRAPYPVLIEGESGAGKERVARGVHEASARRGHPFHVVNCAALPDDLVEAELFGHARGAFTGAIAERVGAFEAAHRGSLFLDEVGELSPRAQAKVLRVVQDGEVRRLGENHARAVDVRIIGATNRDLEAEVAAGRFRVDLFYRLAVLRVQVPPLRVRPADIAPLACAFWQQCAPPLGVRARLGVPLLAALARYHWPGNVRELQNVIASLTVCAPRTGTVDVAALPVRLQASPVVTLARARQTAEASALRLALERHRGVRGAAAAELGVTRQGLAAMERRLRRAEACRPAVERGG